MVYVRKWHSSAFYFTEVRIVRRGNMFLSGHILVLATIALNKCHHDPVRMCICVNLDTDAGENLMVVHCAASSQANRLMAAREGVCASK